MTAWANLCTSFRTLTGTRKHAVTPVSTLAHQEGGRMGGAGGASGSLVLSGWELQPQKWLLWPPHFFQLCNSVLELAGSSARAIAERSIVLNWAGANESCMALSLPTGWEQTLMTTGLERPDAIYQMRGHLLPSGRKQCAGDQGMLSSSESPSVWHC